jgi:hypothetical protein
MLPLTYNSRMTGKGFAAGAVNFVGSNFIS